MSNTIRPFPISIQTAIDWIGNWWNNYTLQLNNPQSNVNIKAFTFAISNFQALISNPNSAYIRFYFGAGPEDNISRPDVIKLIMVAADSNLEDIGVSSGGIHDLSHPCPPICPTNNTW